MSIRGMRCYIVGHQLKTFDNKVEAFFLAASYYGTDLPALPSISHTTSLGRPSPPHRRCPMEVEVKGKRVEERKYMRVGVDLSSIDVRTPAYSGVTDNVSRHGVRVLTSRALKPNDRLNLRSMLGNYRSRARVVYCVPEGEMYAVGLQLYASAGDWISPA
jgi:hypothetical protein